MISVCLASYNGSEYIQDQVLSILNQLCINDEIIVSDNGSSDNTLSILEGFNDPRIKIFIETSPGIISNFSNALNHAQGEFIFLADQDDVWLDGKVEQVFHLLNNEFDLVLHDAVVVDQELNVIASSLFSLNMSRSGFIQNFQKNSYVGCCMAFNRKVLDTALPIPQNVGMHDWWIGLVAEKFFNVAHLSTPLIQYRRHSNNASNTSSKSMFSYSRRIKWRLSILFNIFRLRKRRIH